MSGGISRDASGGDFMWDPGTQEVLRQRFGCGCEICREREEQYRIYGTGAMRSIRERTSDEYSYFEKLNRLERAAKDIGYQLHFDVLTGAPLLVKIEEKKPFKYSKPHPLDAGINYESTNQAPE